jgi:anti-sigma B factor antagonist
MSLDSKTIAKTIAVIKPSGLLDGVKAPTFRQEIDTAIQTGCLWICVNLEEVTFLDSSGLGALVAALKSARSAGGDLYLCGLNKQVQMVFELTSMDRAFRIHETMEDLFSTIAEPV